jgi:hypothetical protein
MRRVQGATVVSYAIVALLMGGTFVGFGAQMLVDRQGPQGRSQLALVLNPLMATADVVSRAPEGGSRVPSPFTPLQSLIDERKKPRHGDSAFLGAPERMVARAVPGVAFSSDLVVEPGVAFDGPVAADGGFGSFRPPLLNRIPIWAMALAGYALLSVGGLTLAARRLATPAAGER